MTPSAIWHWFAYTDAGLLTRMAIGVAIFTALAIVDFRKNGPRATRWREYSILLAAVAAALLYGIVNDQITCTISWEYFFYGKEIDKIIGPSTPPDMTALRWESAKVGMKATWSVGLILGVVLLIANNPMRGWPRLRNRKLLLAIPMIFLVSAVCGAIGGYLGYHGYLTNLSPDFQDMTHANVFRPKRFICTWGIHLGGYVGGFFGAIGASVAIVRKRKFGGMKRET